MLATEFYRLGNLWFQYISDYGDSTLYCVTVPPTQNPNEVYYMEHRWMLSLLGSPGVTEVFSNQKWYVLQHLEEFLVPAHQLHAFRNMQSYPSRFYLKAFPGGFEEYIRSHATLLTPESLDLVYHPPPICKTQDEDAAGRNYIAPQGSSPTDHNWTERF